jgi:hypothetical protein
MPPWCRLRTTVIITMLILSRRELMDTTDEIPLEDHRYFWARLDHLERQHPVALLHHLENLTLTMHLREWTTLAMKTKARLVIEGKLTVSLADEWVMNQIVADPWECSQLYIPASRMRLRKLLELYRNTLPNLPRTYQSENEITE